MQRDEALAHLRHGLTAWGPKSAACAQWALDEIERLEAIPNQIDGLATCAEASGATPNATLLLKLAAAEQRIAELEAESISWKLKLEAAERRFQAQAVDYPKVIADLEARRDSFSSMIEMLRKAQSEAMNG